MANKKSSFKSGYKSPFQNNQENNSQSLQESPSYSNHKLSEFLQHTMGNLTEAYLLSLGELAALKETYLKERLAQVQYNDKQLKKDLEQAKKTLEVYKPQVTLLGELQRSEKELKKELKQVQQEFERCKPQVHLLAELQRSERELKKELHQAKKTIQDYKDKADKSASLATGSSEQILLAQLEALKRLKQK
ncbi:MAG TPA: hypothetical protein PKI88_09095 [Agitococcus sp.]|nr:hypothetical protein [Agitococcus sp.]HNC03088.1 hypothetical protein [Agitococcus sp.]HNJ87081.1 hypothetical protein [Agitococcus sp.]HNL37245.1 hypothetical protein [Agitococcus sp.]